MWGQDLAGNKLIGLVVSYAPGGSADGVSRIISRHLPQRSSVPVIIEYIAGASSNIVVRSAPDGHTIVLAATPLATNPSFYADTPSMYEA